MINEVTVANTLLEARDGQTVRTLSPSCFDKMAKDGNYVEAVKDQFIGVKSLDYLLANKDKYWVDTYCNIMLENSKIRS